MRELHGELISDEIEIAEKYSIFRSFRRGATTRAREMDLPDGVVEVNNRWRKVERNQGSKPKLSMVDLYTDIDQALLTRLRFSQAM